MKDENQDKSASGQNVFLIINKQIVALNHDIVRLGRHLDNNIVLHEEAISRFHAEIRYENNGYTLYDLESKSGTFVNNQRIKRCVLNSGDVISLAGLSIMFVNNNIRYVSRTSGVTQTLTDDVQDNQNEKKQHTILVIDDEPNLLIGVAALLKRDGYIVLVASNGNDGLDIARSSKPDLILSDIMMPPPDGFEIRRLLGIDPELSTIPFIFLTAKTSVEDRISGIREGADDYITKPFNPEELIARIETVFRRVKAEQTRGHDEMKKLAEQEMEKLRREITQNFHHEFRTPLVNVMMPLELAVANKFKDPEEQLHFVKMALSNLEYLDSLVTDMVILTSLDEHNLNTTRQLIDPDIHITKPIMKRLGRYKRKNIHLTLDVQINSEIRMPRKEFTQSVLHLADNAFKFSAADGKVEIEIRSTDEGGVVVNVSDAGIGIPLELRDKVFERFYQISQGDSRNYDGLGVGLTIVKSVSERLGGTVRFLDTASGCHIRMTIPGETQGGGNVNQNTIPIPKHDKAALKDTLQKAEPASDQNFNYRALFEQTEDCVFIISLDFRYIAVNPQAIHLLGYSKQELIGKPVSEILYQDTPVDAENILGNTSNLFERLMRCKDGSTLPVEIRTSIVYNEDGLPAYVQTIARDITERKASEHSLKYRNRILAAINDAAERLLRSSDIQKEIPEMLQILGSTINLAACAIVQAKHPDHFADGVDIRFKWQNPTAPQIDLQAMMHDLPPNRRNKFSDVFINAGDFASPLSIAFIPIFEEDRAWGFLGILAPETRREWAPLQRDAIRTAANIIGAALQRQDTEEKIRVRDEHSRTILDTLPDLIIRVDQFGNILDYSARKDHPLYLQREQANGKKLSEIWNGDIARQIAHVTNDTFLVPVDMRKEFSIPGSNNIYEANLHPISATETMVVIRDISDQARLNQMKSDFINRASHELRTPLTTAILMCNLIQGDGDPADKVEYWQILGNELNRQKSLIDRLLMAGRLESGKLTLEPEFMDLIPILEESVLAIKLVAKKKNITIKLSVFSAPLVVWGDKSGLQQVFINLINNATKFSPEGSSVIINTSKDINKVHISISDQGLGIPQEAIPNLFEQFFRARNVTLAEIPGSGVGLYIVKSIIDELKGEIKVESEINKGTTFIVTLNATR